MLSRKSVLIAALLLILTFGVRTVQADQTPNNPTAPWKLAVVFSRSNGQRTYVGTVANPAVAASLTEATPASKTAHAAPSGNLNADYEVWLVRDGATRGVWVSSTQQQFGDFEAAGRLVGSRADTGTMSALVKRAQPIAYQAIPQNLYHRITEYFSEANSLESQCNQSDVIVTGRVVGVLRDAYTPERASDIMQHTVYVVAVEKDLKHDASGSPAVIKVRISGGLLPGRASATGEEKDLTDPLLDVGARYCLFLTSLGQTPSHKKLGFVPTFYGGKPARYAELDEYQPLSHWQAKILLKDGFTRAPRTVGAAIYDHWRFGYLFGTAGQQTQIMDITENDALDAIRQAVTH